jgi:hypothetical protein
MPRPKELEPLVKVELRLYERDYAQLKELYPIAGPARVIRKLVRNYLDQRINSQRAPAPIDLEIELSEEDLDLATEA